jgi:hypothetical protein
MRGEVVIPTHDITAADGRALVYFGHTPPQHAGGGAYITLHWWRSADDLAVAASLDPLPHQTVTSKPRFLHLSISRPDRYPGWDEMVAAVEAIAGSNLDMAMIKPKRSDYISPHPNCFHWWEMPSEWGLQ